MKPNRMMTRILLGLAVAGCLLAGSALFAQSATENQDAVKKAMDQRYEALNHRLDVLEKAVDDILWYNKVGDVAFIDKIRQVGPPPANEPNPTGIGAGNPVKFYSYIFIPRTLDPNRKYPLLVFPHGGVHANFTTYYTHIIRELIAQGYVIIAPEYRGSTGYGADMYRLIDYGGREVDDAHAARDYMLKNYDFIDPDRVGMLGWSHGGLITLMNIFNYPKDYKVAFAGVPVSDLVLRMGYMTDDYRELYSAVYHIGKTANQDLQEYKRRSPVWNVEKLQTPLLVHTNTTDDDVNYIEVEHLIQALKAAGKKFEYQVFQAAPGGHSFDRLDTMMAKEIRVKIYKFLAGYLSPDKPISTVKELQAAGYRF